MAIYKCGRGFEPGTTENKSSKWPERDSNPGPPDFESNALTTRPRYLLTEIENVLSHNLGSIKIDIKFGPRPPNQRWENGAFWLSREFILDLRDGGLLFYFILSKNAGRKSTGH